MLSIVAKPNLKRWQRHQDQAEKIRLEATLEKGLEETFPASDAVAATVPGVAMQPFERTGRTSRRPVRNRSMENR